MKLLKTYGLALISALCAFAYANAQTGSIKVGPFDGNVTIVNANGVASEATADTVFAPPSTIITDENSTILLYLSNGAVIEIKPGSRVEIAHFGQEPFSGTTDPFAPGSESSSSQVSINVISGEVAANVTGLGEGSTFVISTPTSDIQASGAVVVVNYDAATANTQVTNAGGSGSVVYESSTPGSTPASVPAGQSLDAPGQINSATGSASTSGNPTVGPASSSALASGQTVSSPPAPSSSSPATPTTPPTGTTTTPQTDLPDLIDPTSTEPNN